MYIVQSGNEDTAPFATRYNVRDCNKALNCCFCERITHTHSHTQRDIYLFSLDVPVEGQRVFKYVKRLRVCQNTKYIHGRECDMILSSCFGRDIENTGVFGERSSQSPQPDTCSHPRRGLESTAWPCVACGLRHVLPLQHIFNLKYRTPSVFSSLDVRNSFTQMEKNLYSY